MSRPPAGAKASRKNANALTTTELAVAPTPKLCANCGSTGVMSPKPSAMTKAEAMRTQISRGIFTCAPGSVRGEADTIHQYAVRSGQPPPPRLGCPLPVPAGLRPPANHAMWRQRLRRSTGDDGDQRRQGRQRDEEG